MTRDLQFDALTGDAGTILFAMFGPKQHDWHVERRRRYLADKRLAGNVARVNENLRLGRPKWENVS